MIVKGLRNHRGDEPEKTSAKTIDSMPRRRRSKKRAYSISVCGINQHGFNHYLTRLKKYALNGVEFCVSYLSNS
jgi:hypothetical protein